mgnify:CR=1 FL=1
MANPIQIKGGRGGKLLTAELFEQIIAQMGDAISTYSRPKSTKFKEHGKSNNDIPRTAPFWKIKPSWTSKYKLTVELGEQSNNLIDALNVQGIKFSYGVATTSAFFFKDEESLTIARLLL